ncbi:MAG: hypothetical protein ACD_43C00107G0004 [uncultured bacterium]|nr:MAG: hypothetical protein ACD_43C00107G0004 [uncultured bacterium]
MAEPVNEPVKLRENRDEPAEVSTHQSAVTKLFERLRTGEYTPSDAELYKRVRAVADRKLERLRRGTDEDLLVARGLHVEKALQHVKKYRHWDFTIEQYNQLKYIASQDAQADPAGTETVIAKSVVAEVESLADGFQESAAEGRYGLIELHAIEDAYELVTLEDKAYRHEVTGLLKNREAIRDRFNMVRREFLESAEADEVILVGELDIAKFKPLNDRFGNGVIDQFVLHDLGERLRSNVRRSEGGSQKFRVDDIICHVGGDEFQFILRVKKDAVEDVIRMIQATFEDEEYTIFENKGGRISHETTKIKTRIGVELLGREQLEAMDTSDAAAWFNAVLRKNPLAAAAYVKFNTGTGNAIWTPDMQIPPEAAEAMEVDAFLRSLSTFVADISAALSQAEAEKMATELAAVYAKRVKKKYAQK